MKKPVKYSPEVRGRAVRMVSAQTRRVAAGTIVRPAFVLNKPTAE